jgi:hypothetical protein
MLHYFIDSPVYSIVYNPARQPRVRGIYEPLVGENSLVMTRLSAAPQLHAIHLLDSD